MVHDKRQDHGDMKKGRPNFFVGKNQKVGHLTNGEEIFEILAIRRKPDLSLPFSGIPETIS